MKSKLSKGENLLTLGNELIKSTDEQDINRIVLMFNLNIKKKEVIRAAQFSKMQDNIAKLMQERIARHSDEFSNKDLLDYFNAIQHVLDVLTQQGNINVPVPQIEIQQLNLYPECKDLDRDSINRITAFIQSILDSDEVIELGQSEITETNYIDLGQENKRE